MEWYVILFIVVSIVIFAQTVLSFVVGDFDLDMDPNFDLSDAFSFKGFLHFVFGFSLTLTAFGLVNFKIILLALFVGVLFMYLLYKLYYFLYTTLEQKMNYTNEITYADAEVYYWDESSQRGEVFITLEGRQTTVNIENKSSEPINLSAGQIIKVSGTRILVNKV